MYFWETLRRTIRTPNASKIARRHGRGSNRTRSALVRGTLLSNLFGTDYACGGSQIMVRLLPQLVAPWTGFNHSPAHEASSLAHRTPLKDQILASITRGGNEVRNHSMASSFDCQIAPLHDGMANVDNNTSRTAGNAAAESMSQFVPKFLSRVLKFKTVCRNKALVSRVLQFPLTDNQHV